MYIRKTRDRWDLMSNYGYGWECECSDYTYKEAKQTLREYRENGGGIYRLEKNIEIANTIGKATLNPVNSTIFINKQYANIRNLIISGLETTTALQVNASYVRIENCTFPNGNTAVKLNGKPLVSWNEFKNNLSNYIDMILLGSNRLATLSLISFVSILLCINSSVTVL